MRKPLKNTGTERLSDAIDFEKDIAPYNLIQLVAGVGAGKNFWACELANEGYRVLLITSRRATADAQARHMKADKWFDFDSLFKNENVWGTFPGIQKKAICTNKQIEWFVKEWYDSEDPKTHVWNYFDFIFLDEAHSLSSDATFTDSPFYVERFLKYAHKQNKNCKIIVMTGTPEPIDWLFAGSEEAVHKLNYFKECIHVEPPKVYLCPKLGLMETLKLFYNQNKRFIYFANNTVTIKTMMKKLQKMGVPEEAIGVGYSGNDADVRFSEIVIKRKDEIEKSLTQKEKLPDEIKIFLTTSKNKEGISINDEDIHAVFSESHIHADLTQMVGRVRNGVQAFYVIYEANPHASKRSALMEYLGDTTSKVTLLAIEKYKENNLSKGIKIENSEIVKEIEENYHYIKYDRLADKFYKFKGCIEGEKKTRRDNISFESYIESWNTPCNKYDETGFELFQEWFPYSEIIFIENRINTGFKSLQEEVDDFMERKNVIGRRIDYDELLSIRDEINEIIFKHPEKERPRKMKEPMKTPKALLRNVNYLLNYRKNGVYYNILKIEESE